MPVLLRASSGYLKRHPWQLGLALLGICTGVAVMVAVDLANQSSRKAFLTSMDAVNGQATHQVVGGPGGLDESLYTELRVQHGFRAIAPVVSGYVRAGDDFLPLMGVDVFAESTFRQYSLPQGRPGGAANANPDAGRGPQSMVRDLLTGDGGVLMSRSSAARLGLAAGERFDLSVDGIRHEATLLGVMGGEDADRLGDLVIADISVAQQWLGMEGRLSRIDVRLAGDPDWTPARLAALLPPGVQLLSAAGRTETTAEMSDAFMTNLAAMSLLALLVGIFLIYNSVAFAVLQRRGLIGVLRALGVTRRELFGLILLEAAALGIAGSLLGVVAGHWLGGELLSMVARTISEHYFAVAVTNLNVDPASIATGLAAGIGATLAAAAVPAWEASSYRPRLAMTRSSLETGVGRLVFPLAAAGVLVVLLALAMLALSGRSLVAGLSALFILILGYALTVPALAATLSRWLGRPAGRIWGVPGRLAVDGVSRSLSRTGVAIVALSVAVSATIGVSLMVDSFRGTVSRWLQTTLQSDVYVGVPRGNMNDGLIADISALDGVDAVSTSRRAWLETEGTRTRIIALRMAPGSYRGTRLRTADPDAAWRGFDQESAILVSDAYAYTRRVAAGDRVGIVTRQGPVEFTVAAVYESYDANGGAIMMSRATYDRYFDDPGVDSIGLYLNDPQMTTAIMDRIRQLANGRQALIMNSNARIREISLRIFDRTFVITNVLYWLAVGVAIIGILGAMLALQLERARELGVLRAVGMTPRQTGGLVGVQCGFIGILAGIAAIPLGLLMAWVLVEVINRRAFGWQIDLSVSPQPLVSAWLIAVGAALVAGIYPAWRAARASPARAIREE